MILPHINTIWHIERLPMPHIEHFYGFYDDTAENFTLLLFLKDHIESNTNFIMCVCKACRVNEPLTGWITSKVATAQTHTAAPQLEACLRHALPLGAHLVVGLCECVIAGIPIGCNGYVAWNCRRAEKKHVFKTDWGRILWVQDFLTLKDKHLLRLHLQSGTNVMLASLQWCIWKSLCHVRLPALPTVTTSSRTFSLAPSVMASTKTL